MVRSATRLRAALVGFLAAALGVAGALAVPAAASADPGDDVLIFSNPDVVDATNPGDGGGEYNWISQAVAAAGYTVIPFDGGDGEASTWQAALEDVEVFLLPEQENGPFYDPDAPPSWMSEAAKDVLVDWVRSGGTMIVSGICAYESSTASRIEYLIGEMVGVSYNGRFLGCTGPSTSVRFIDDDGLPETLGWLDGTYTMRLDGLTAEQLAPLTVWYAGVACVEELAVGEFAAGAGRIGFEAWDYYYEVDYDPDTTGQDDWNLVLAALIEGTSASSTWAPTPPPAKDPVTATTAAGDTLYTVSEVCGRSGLYRVHPGTAAAAPIGETVHGWAAQGAWNAVNGRVYLPFYDYGDDHYHLATVDLATGALTIVGEFTVGGDGISWIYGLAIGPDGAAYLFGSVWDEDVFDHVLSLYSVDLSNATLTRIADVDPSELRSPYGFAADPATGEFFVFDYDGVLFEVDVTDASLTPLGALDAPSWVDGYGVSALQIGADGTFWVVFEVPADGPSPGMLARFTWANVTGGAIAATEVGVLTDDPMPSYSLLLVPGPARHPATGADTGATGLGALGLLALGALLAAAAAARRRFAPAR